MQGVLRMNRRGQRVGNGLGCLLMFLATMSTFAQDAGVGVNVLPDPSFEGAVPDGWESRAWQGKENTEWSIASIGRNGKKHSPFAREGEPMRLGRLRCR